MNIINLYIFVNNQLINRNIYDKYWHWLFNKKFHFLVCVCIYTYMYRYTYLTDNPLHNDIIKLKYLYYSLQVINQHKNQH